MRELCMHCDHEKNTKKNNELCVNGHPHNSSNRCQDPIKLEAKYAQNWERRKDRWSALPDWESDQKWNTSMKRSQKSRAGLPPLRTPASREMISASVELCETEVCSLHISNLWWEMCDCQKYTSFLPKSMSNLQYPQKNLNTKGVPIYFVVQCFPHDNIVRIHSWDGY